MASRDPLVERITRTQAAAATRAARLQELLPRLAADLRVRGAVRVRAFGSLMTGAPPHADTDVDLCVWGLDAAAADDATLALEQLASARVDLVRWEAASERLRRRIESDGVDVTGPL